jgi:type II secretory pathway pseudopilin PulG
MMVRLKQAGMQKAARAFTLIEVLISFIIFGLVTSGIIYGYVLANRMAEYSSQSLAATSYAMQGLEQMRSVQWETEMVPTTNGPGTTDVLPLTLQADGTSSYTTNEVDYMDIPTTGQMISITNFITVTQIHTHPDLRQIMSQVVWTFSPTGRQYTNTIVTLRAPDQFQ